MRPAGSVPAGRIFIGHQNLRIEIVGRGGARRCEAGTQPPAIELEIAAPKT